MTSPYATDKILWHPEAFARLRERERPHLVQVHFMPTLSCGHRCHFCAYQSKDESERVGWKNKVSMDGRSEIPWPKAEELLEDLRAMGVRAVEITGGGEPTQWTHFDRFLEGLQGTGIKTALVTHGGHMSEDRAALLASTAWQWARVSIDAGTAGQYAAMRRVSERWWERAWHAVRRLAEVKTRPDQRVGVGYVVDARNADGLVAAAARARDAGADNIRFSLAFTPQGLQRFPPGALDTARRQAARAVELYASESFQVVDLVSERAGNLAAPAQDYEFCFWKSVGCVIGGDLNVYHCCSLAFNPMGLVGSWRERRFRELWESAETDVLIGGHDPRRHCPVECLYEGRNKSFLAAEQWSAEKLAAHRSGVRPLHVDFI